MCGGIRLYPVYDIRQESSMTTILLRTLIIYILLISVMRLMGKRQIGQLEVSELAVTLILRNRRNADRESGNTY